MAVYTCSGQMFYRYSSNMVQRAHSLLRRPLAPQWTPCYHQNPSKISKTIKFAPSTTNSAAPWWRIAKAAVSVCSACSKDASYQVSSKSVDIWEYLLGKNWRTEAYPPAQYGSLCDPKGGASPHGGRGGGVGVEGRFVTILLRPNRPEKGNHLASLGG